MVRADQVKFLGMTIVKGLIAISKKAINKAMDKVKTLIPKRDESTNRKGYRTDKHLVSRMGSYFKMIQYPAQLAAIEVHIRRRLRARNVKQQKCRRNLYRKLIKQGVGKKMAAKTAYSNKRTWNLSHTRAVEKAFPNKWFEKAGLKIVSNLGLGSLDAYRYMGEVNVKSRVRTRTHVSVR